MEVPAHLSNLAIGAEAFNSFDLLGIGSQHYVKELPGGTLFLSEPQNS
jgi:hypothetical protein